jgi:hypothetical protein
MKKVICPMPSRERDDDKVVEVFLHAYQQGQFAKGAQWLPQHEKNVEVVAKAPDGTRLAIEHTRVFAFDGHMQQEKVLRPIAECLEAVRVPACGQKVDSNTSTAELHGQTPAKASDTRAR